MAKAKAKEPKSIDLTIDLDDMSLGEIVDFEDASGSLIGSIDESNLSARELVALVWIAQRRTDPDFTFDDAREVKVSQLNIPTEAAPLEPIKRTAKNGRKKSS